MRKRILVIMALWIGLTGIALTIIPSLCFACKCVEPDGAEVELEESQAVFSGKVMDVVVQKS
ncbi:hypothetical protein [Bacillus sp. UNCCL13]|nr:hypothetical protein [Bacillus sp. UNCCL13]